MVVYECGWMSGDNGEREFEDFDAVKFAGKTVWTKDKCENVQAPEYVFAYDEFECANGKISSWTIEQYPSKWKTIP